MSPSPPRAPDDLPAAVVTSMGDLSPASLRDLAAYAQALADHREREAVTADADESQDADDVGDDLPDDVPSKATLTVKEINDNRYHYWQWRDGDQIKSKYKGPATGDE